MPASTAPSETKAVLILDDLQTVRLLNEVHPLQKSDPLQITQMHVAKSMEVQWELAEEPPDWYRLQAHQIEACAALGSRQGMHLPAHQAAQADAHPAAPMHGVHTRTRLCLASSFTFPKIIFSLSDFSTRASEAAAGRPQMVGCLHACVLHCCAVTSS